MNGGLAYENLVDEDGERVKGTDEDSEEDGDDDHVDTSTTGHCGLARAGFTYERTVDLDGGWGWLGACIS